MRPLRIEPIGEELAIRWDDGQETFISLEKLRRYCPCAGCKGEVDVMGNLHKGPEIPLKASSFQLQRLEWVGSYAIQPIWADGHNAGLFAFDYLSRISQAPN